MDIPCSFPVYSQSSKKIEDGALIQLSSFCHDRILRGDEKCMKHYEQLEKRTAFFYQCPYGFTTHPFKFGSESFAITGLVATPRFKSPAEMERAKQFPAVRVSREAINRNIKFLTQVESTIERLEDEARTRLPQALHELRKLNAIVKQNAEVMEQAGANSAEIKNISGAAELMTNIFEVIEALANLDGLKQIKLDQYVAVYDLAFKAKKIYQIRAKERPIHIHVGGNRTIGIMGSKKTFPIVLTVLLENAIKYGLVDSTINIEISRLGADCILEVRNQSDLPIDANSCFDRGVRFGLKSDDGSGLGLYLAREVVRAHGGSIECLVEQGVVTMKVSVPAASASVR